MPLFLHQWSYKDGQIRRMLLESDEHNRAEVVRTAVAAFGGRLHSFYYCFGPCDGMAVAEFPDQETALACVMSIYGQGRIQQVQTTALFSPEEGLRAMRQAQELIGTGGAPSPQT
jgi:uncharacterized protein with GYD domain